jgi:predicted nucleic acid-binding protein
VIFVGTSFWVALRNRRDPHHQEALGLLERHGGTPLVSAARFAELRV